MVKEGKGAKDRTLWVNDLTLDDLREWGERQAEDVKGKPEYVFTTLKGGKLHRNYILQMVKWCTEKAEIDKT